MASHAQRKIEPRSLERLKKRRDASTRKRQQIQRRQPADQPIGGNGRSQNIDRRHRDHDVGDDHAVGIAIQEFDQGLAYLVFLHRIPPIVPSNSPAGLPRYR
ncbi:hypothetical protein P3C58_23115 [Mesorhizobium sp. XAP10]|uniref:hypothetical protein n=1 Tax=unclassified Mesorhizobium TaxID=325217 RepID=UPI0023DF4916|nr:MULTISPECIES: hypothetical protein [unclassified Mesorhizobium]MDF3154875.1 hypothetical protein [Mesorhizobium sp. XAP10]MDF3247575.1 hypothetical protein [Mesorhizobium sp. XAP4]